MEKIDKRINKLHRGYILENYKTMTDKQIAEVFKVDYLSVRKMRRRMGIVRDVRVKAVFADS